MDDSPPAAVRFDARVLTNAWLVRAVAALRLTTLLGVVLTTLAFFFWNDAASFVLLATLLSLVIQLVHERARVAVVVRKPSTITIEADAVVVRRERPMPIERIARSKLRSGLVIPAEAGAVRVVARGREGVILDAELANRNDARTLLRELGLSPLEQSASFDFFFGLRVTVGADGVLLHWPLLGKRRFVALARIASIETERDVVGLRLTDGTRFDILTHASLSAASLERHHALHERIEDVCEAYRARGESAPLHTLLRAGRSAKDWVAALRAMGSSATGGYREGMPPRDVLLRVALDPTAPEEIRIGAGVVLQGELDERTRLGLRFAAEAAASPRVRVALMASADDADDDELAEAVVGRKRTR